MCLWWGCALLAVASAAGAINPSLGVRYGHAQWTLVEGLPSNWIIDLRQEPESGLMWIATPGALTSFDGERFETFGVREYPFLQGGAWALEIDAAGELWVGTRAHGVLHYADGRFDSFGREEGLRDEEARLLYFDARGQLWVGTPSGLFVRRGERFEEAYPETFGHRVITALREDGRGRLWVGTQDDGLFLCDETGAGPLLLQREHHSATIQALATDSEGAMWVGTKQGLYRITDGDTRFYSDEDGLPSRSVRALRSTGDGLLWVGTESGLAAVSQGRVIPMPGDNPSVSTFVTTLFEDLEGSLWVGSKFHGVGQFWKGKFQVFDHGGGMENDVVNVLIEEGASSYLVGTQRGLYRLSPQGVEPFHPEVLGERRVRGLLRDRQGVLWVATYSGLYRLAGGQWEHLGMDDGLTSDLVRAVFEDREGRIWVGTRAGLNRLDAEGIVSWQKPQIPNDLIMHLTQTADGAIWVATDGGGVGRYIDGGFEWLGPEEGLSSGVVFDVYEADDGRTVWLATSGGLSALREGRFTTLGQAQGIPSETIFQVMEDAAGDLWYTAHEGIYRLPRAEAESFIAGESSSVQVVRYGPKDGLKTYQMTGVGKSIRDARGRLLFASTQGVAVIQPESYRINTRPPRVFIRDVRVDQASLGSGWEGREVPAGTRRVEIDFASDSHISAHDILYEWRLLGFDADWTRTRDNRAIFTNLSPGAYRFQIRSRNADGVWSETVRELAFTVSPRVVETWWFRALLVLLAATVIVLVFRWRLALLHAESRRLEALVEERTAEIRMQKEELEHSQRIIEKSNQELKKLNDAQRHMLGVAAHDMRNPVGNIHFLAEDMRAEFARVPGAPHPLSEHADLISRSSSELLELVDGVVHNSTLEGGDLALSIDAEDVSRLLRSVVETNRRSAKQKGQRLHVEAEGAHMAEVDIIQLRSAIDNLVSNAIKYAPAQTDIVVAIQSLPSDRLRIAVKDEGPGLTREDLERVFGKFARLSARPTAGESSSGMGLAIVKQIVERHGGLVGVRNRDTGGAEFWFEIPLRQ